MLVMMTVNVRRRFSVQPNEFLYLRLVNVTELASQHRVVQQERILTTARERYDLPMIVSQELRLRFARQSLTQIEMQTDVDSFVFRNLGGPLRIIHKDHGSRRSDS